MRVNIYSQELTEDTELVTTIAKDTGLTYHGVRLYLHSPDILHHSKGDDDRSAITLWIPHAKSFDKEALARTLERMARLVRKAPEYRDKEKADGARE